MKNWRIDNKGMIERIIHDIYSYFSVYAFDATMVGILVMLIYACIFFYCNEKRKSGLFCLGRYIKNMLFFYVAAFLAGAYLYIVLCIALLSRTEEYIDQIDFSLFGVGLYTETLRAYFVENIIMFIPFGILLPVCFKKAGEGGRTILIAFLLSLSIEELQYITKCGRFELVDLWTNTFGAALGYFFFRIMFHFYGYVRKQLDK